MGSDSTVSSYAIPFAHATPVDAPPVGARTIDDVSVKATYDHPSFSRKRRVWRERSGKDFVEASIRKLHPASHTRCPHFAFAAPHRASRELPR